MLAFSTTVCITQSLRAENSRWCRGTGGTAITPAPRTPV